MKKSKGVIWNSFFSPVKNLKKKPWERQVLKGPYSSSQTESIAGQGVSSQTVNQFITPQRSCWCHEITGMKSLTFDV